MPFLVAAGIAAPRHGRPLENCPLAQTGGGR
jgi:hypothetical protein